MRRHRDKACGKKTDRLSIYGYAIVKVPQHNCHRQNIFHSINIHVSTFIFQSSKELKSYKDIIISVIY